MGLAWRWLVNVVLLGLPIGITLGILLGLQTQRESTGGPPLFKPEPGPGPGGDNGISWDLYCQKAFGIHPESVGQEYTLNPNQWGWKEGDPGSLCMNVTTFNNQTYSSKTTAPEFSVTWQYPPGPESAPVHAFPNIKVDGNVFPTTLNSIEKIVLDFEWTYGVGNGTVTTTDEDELEENKVNANVALDMFIDKDKKKAGESEEAAYEIMVWFAAYGPATQPIGLNDGVVTTETLGGTTFSLLTGQNQNGQNVLTWITSKPAEKFHGDLAPLVERILGLSGTGLPSKSDYLGYMSLGTEAYSADKNVTFHVPELSIDVQSS